MERGLMQEATHDAQSVADAVDDSADSRPAPWLAAALTLAVSACGGSGDSGGEAAHGGRTPAPPPIPPTPIPPAPAPGPVPPPPRDSVPATDAEAARFLLQAQFSASDAEIASLKSGGLVAWLNARYAEPLGQGGVV